jgi:hypothetical protein
VASGEGATLSMMEIETRIVEFPSVTTRRCLISVDVDHLYGTDPHMRLERQGIDEQDKYCQYAQPSFSARLAWPSKSPTLRQNHDDRYRPITLWFRTAPRPDPPTLADERPVRRGLV